MASTDLILITGASGHLGFRTLAIALERGLRIRLALRSQKRFDAVKSALKEHYSHLDASKLEYVEVPDLAATGAFDVATKGVSGVVHIASPITTDGFQLSTDEYHKYFIEPAVKGTIGMLESAKKSGTVKRVVITSSIVAIQSFLEVAGAAKQTETLTNESRIPLDQGPYTLGEFQAYSASKAAALNETVDWLAREKPQFDVVNLNPSFIEGRDDLRDTAASVVTGTNAVILSIALGIKWEDPKLGASVHNEDVARSHVDALRPEIPAGTYILNYQPKGTETGSDWALVPGLVEKLFPEEVKAGALKPHDSHPSATPLRIDGRKTAEVFGFKYLDLEQQVKSVVGHYVELLKKEGKV